MDDALKEDYCPYFGLAWESGLGLAEYLFHNDLGLNNKRVLEIGSGLSLPSFVLDKKGYDVTACDFHRDVEIFLKFNQKLNNSSFKYKSFNWRDGNQYGTKYNLVMGSDVLYESNHPLTVASTLLSFVEDDGLIILSDPGRNYLKPFLVAMSENTILKEKITHAVKTEWTEKEISIFIFRKIKISK